MLARTMIEGGIENRGIRKLHRNLRVPSAACYSYTIPRNRHFRNWTSIMPISTRTNCISGGHTAPVFGSLPLCRIGTSRVSLLAKLYTQHPLVCYPQEADIQLGQALYKRAIRLGPARNLKLVFTQLPKAGSAGHPTAIQLMSFVSLSHLSFIPFRVDFISGMHLRLYEASPFHGETFAISMTLMVYSSLSWCPTSSIKGLSVLNSFHDVRLPLKH